MIKFTDTEANTKYEIAAFGDHSIKLSWAQTLVTVLMLTIHKGDSIIGQVSAPMHSDSLSTEEKWEAFVEALRAKLATIDVGDDAEQSELEILWNRIAALIFEIKDNHIIFSE